MTGTVPQDAATIEAGLQVGRFFNGFRYEAAMKALARLVGDNESLRKQLERAKVSEAAEPPSEGSAYAALRHIEWLSHIDGNSSRIGTYVGLLRRVNEEAGEALAAVPTTGSAEQETEGEDGAEQSSASGTAAEPWSAWSVKSIPDHRTDELPVYFKIDRQSFAANVWKLTGAELRALGGVPDDFVIWHMSPWDYEDNLVDEGGEADLRGGRFYSAPRFINGGSDAAVPDERGSGLPDPDLQAARTAMQAAIWDKEAAEALLAATQAERDEEFERFRETSDLVMQRALTAEARLGETKDALREAKLWIEGVIYDSSEDPESMTYQGAVDLNARLAALLGDDEQAGKEQIPEPPEAASEDVKA